MQGDASKTVDDVYYEVARPQTLAERLVVRARDRMYADFLRCCQPSPGASILDVGVSDVVTDAANMLERLYPHPDRITAAGLGAGDGFRRAYPNVRYRQVDAGQRLPFEDDAFDIVTSNAVLEHVGSRQAQRDFVRELLRVGRTLFLTVPHRFFPVEHHTGLPLLHWTDASFRLACALTGKSHWSQEANLIPMSRRILAEACPPSCNPEIAMTGIRLGPFSSNLMLYIRRA